MKSTNPGLRLTASAQPAAFAPSEYFSALLCASCISGGLAAVLVGGFPQLAPGWAVAVGIAMAAVVLLFCGRMRRWVLPVGGVLMLAAGLIWHTALQSGLAALGNDILKYLTTEKAQIYLAYDTPGAGWLPLMLLQWACTMPICLAVAQRRIWPVLPLVLLAAAGVGCSFFAANWALALLGAGFLLLWLRCGGSLPMRDRAVTLVMLALMMGAACLGARWLSSGLPQDGTQRFAAWLHRVRYDHASQSMPEGQLSDLSPWNKSDAIALGVTTSAPQKLYLRGMTGEVYTGTAWQPLDGEALSDEADLFYHLHQHQFYAQSQIGAVAGMLGNGERETISVTNYAACGRYAYLPYALCQTLLQRADAIGDSTVFSGGQTASAQFYSGSVPQWFALQGSLAENQAEFADYLLYAQAYGDFVQRHYLQVSDTAAAVLNRQLGGNGSPKTLEEIKQEIRNYLDEHLYYNEESYTMSGDSDFLQYTLEQSCVGYSVHYATAAALMLRYYGVPARYVEGYFLSATDAASYAPGDTIRLTEENAHAWAEYYLDGVGWIPFETTPGYVDGEEEQLPSGQSDKTYTTDQNLLQVETPQEITIPDKKKQQTPFAWQWLLLLPLILLLAFLALTALRRGRLHRRLAQLHAAEDKAAIALWFGYAQTLLRHCPGAQAPPTQQQVYDLNCQALFSQHTATPEQRKMAEQYAADVLQACKQQWSGWKKFYYRWVYCLY